MMMIKKNYLNVLNNIKRQINYFSTLDQQELKNNKYKVVFDEKRIKEKIQDIKQGKINKKIQYVSQLMPNYKIQKKSQKINQFRKKTQTESLFNYDDQTLDQKSQTMQITGYSNQQIQIGDLKYPPAIIVFPRQILIWQITSTPEINFNHFSILKFIQPIPTYIIFGVNKLQQISPQLMQQFRDLEYNIDVLEMFEAVSQYNVAINDDVNLVAFFSSH